ncbi:hypothetical protein VTN96DRAFT_8307 [Rasamsonia emersonii]|uniref:Mitochondrial import inner membrane translocase subunit n=1 Tax=Rasamsonia emersonii (strain ATCC 16479 / CBS 393.64 / IMI 116815) TaxID=1408163 RepID=A0A0F4YFA9_RASE3|nr:Mitochondrial intermembrane space translocase subunit Tim13 [Rasamsonia emersonii CBS 393.64]KKA16829.1 Mitochondrial intermembrane space translocase subunit Tim13 [Rasamsonia emersonii CBS 393.64]
MPLFGGSSSSSSSSSGNSASSDATSAELKSALMQQVQAEAALNNARALMTKMNENCFDRCIPNPGSSLSSQESTCLSTCMEKYISMWNTTSRAYIARIGRESKKMGGGVDAGTLASLGTPSS